MPIAIVGMSCRFSGGADSPEKLWKLLAEGRNTWTKVPGSRYNQTAFYHPEGTRAGVSNAQGAHFLERDVSHFDAPFFNFPTEVADSMDPQLRMQLEGVYEALESAGIPMEQFAGSKASVFAGASFRDYHDTLMRDPDFLPRYFLTGNGAAMGANRISHFYNLRGPSMTVDTGCSTTLTALHLACQSLRAGDSTISVVTGSNIMLNPDMFETLASVGFLGSTGKSFAFDDRAQGYGRGDGVATIIIKPLSDAVRDGDPIRAVIRQTALNQDGHTPTLTSPSKEAQEELVRSCYRSAGLDPVDTTYVEAHGTGTRVGDPIEAEALSRALNRDRPVDEPLLIGSIKSNIGHAETASGLASIIKVSLALEKGFIPPNADFRTSNPAIPVRDWKIKIPTFLTPWPGTSQYRRASINNFGYGGSNAHVILEAHSSTSLSVKAYSNGCKGSDANGRANGHTNGSTNGHHAEVPLPRVFVLSAKDERGTRKMMEDLAGYLEKKQVKDDEELLRDVAFTLGQRRSRFPWTAVVAAISKSQLIQSLQDGMATVSRSPKQPRLGFVFTGQGAQWHAMGRELIEAYPVFKDALLEAERHIRSFGASWNLLEELMRDEKTTMVNVVTHSLTICTALQLALVRLLRSWNIKPAAVTSHSSGEVASAYAAGALDFRSALAICYLRGTMATDFKSRAGGMLAAGLGHAEAEEYIAKVTSGTIVVACVNSPSSVTISGDVEALEEIEALLVADKVFARRLTVQAAYHSPQMQPFAKDYRAALAEVLHQAGEFDDVLYSSPVTGGVVQDASEIARPEHWVKNMVQPVLFTDSLTNMCQINGCQNVDTIIEIGPHSALRGPMRQTWSEPVFKGMQFSYTSCLARKQDAVQTIQALVSTLINQGYPVDLGSVNFPTSRHGLRVLTDLPSYPWNHGQRYWVEPRVNKERRLRVEGPRGVLGVPAVSYDPSTSTWRSVIRSSEFSWIQDHKIQSDMVFPGAGYITMAIEAIMQTRRSTETSVNGYKLKNVEILKALVIPDTLDGVEISLSLRALGDRALSAKEWREFTVSSTSDEGVVTIHCTGLVAIVEGPSNGSSISNGSGNYETDSGSYPCDLKPTELYKSLQSGGINHGPSFQKLVSVSSGEGCSRSTFETPGSSPHEHSYLIHPITLDVVIQSVYGCLMGSDRRMASGMVPRSIESMFISSEISSMPGHMFKTTSKLTWLNAQGFESSIAVVDKDQPSSNRLEIGGLFCQNLGGALQTGDSETAEPYFRVEWAPDLDLARSEVLRAPKQVSKKPTDNAIFEDIRNACYHFAHNTLSSSEEAQYDQDSEQGRFYSRLETLAQSAKANGWTPSTPEEQEALIKRVSELSVAGKIICRIGSALVPILHNEVNPLDLVEKDGLLSKYDEECLRLPDSYEQVKHILRLFSHKSPRASVLQIGARTNKYTEVVLEALGAGSDDGDAARFAQYTYTASSPEILQSVQERFEAREGVMRFQELDIDEDPTTQSFEQGSLDLIIACEALFKAKSVSETLKNLKKLLKPGGRILLVEPTQDELAFTFAFGLLPGWSGQSYRHDEWRSLLRESGFHLEFDACDEDSRDVYALSTILAIAKESDEGLMGKYPPITILYDSPPPESWTKAMNQTLFNLTGEVPQFSHYKDALIVDRLCIFVAEMIRPFLLNPTNEEFNLVKSLFNQSQGILWISRGGAMDCVDPNFSLSAGLFRTLRAESTNKRFVTLDLDHKKPEWDVCTTQIISAVTRNTFNLAQSSESIPDFEYVERDGIISLPRLFPAPSTYQTAAGLADKQYELQPFLQDDRELRLCVGTTGLLDTLSFAIQDTETPLPDTCVEIRPQAFGLNFRDIMVALGQLQTDIMGYECSGVVTRVGAAVPSSELKVGDRICAFTQGYYSNVVRVDWTRVHRIPDNMSFEVAASVPMAFATGYYALYTLANLQKGERVLIHSAAGGVGQAAVMMAQHIGAEVFVSVGSKEKREFVQETYGVPADHIVSSRDPSFAQDILAKTGGQGVDVVLNSLGDFEQNRLLEMETFKKNVSFSSIDLVLLGKYRGPVYRQILANAMKMLEAEILRPVSPIQTYPISDLEKAFRLMQAGKHMGKIVIVPGQDDLVIPQEWSLRLDSNKTYLLAGGLGGIGRSICKWMVGRGARNFILLTRSQSTCEKAAPFLDELRASGCLAIAKSCNFSSKHDLEAAVHASQDFMPPIQGVINCAMALRDSIFDLMTPEGYVTAINPKVQGSWNLHEIFSSTQLDFFIMLSSLVGVAGNVSQANYSAGGSFQDALARYRNARRLPGVTLDLGMVSSVGYVSENEAIGTRLARFGFKPLDEGEVLRLVESAMIHPHRQVDDSHIVTGLITDLSTVDPSDAYWTKDRRFAAVTRAYGLQGNGNTSSADLKSQLATAPSIDEAVVLLSTSIAEKMSKMFLIPAEDISLDQSLTHYGVDSLVAVELRNWLASNTGTDPSIFDIMQSTSIKGLAVRIIEKFSRD
uniref:Carrier domain-containing protein n=1 Tax=Bionectria ochroleuca TaxID=29856 RepID=A0A8H7N2E1_BIOOC